MNEKPDIRVPITMTEKMINYMEALSMKSKVTGGHKLPNTAIVRACVKVAMDLDIDVTGIKDENELKMRIMEARTKYTPRNTPKKKQLGKK
jgi:hypothetical protein